MKPLLILLSMLLTATAYAQEASVTSPSQKIILENQKVKVTLFESRPGQGVCGLKSHSHGAHLTVLLTDATVTVSLPDGKAETHKMPAGTTFWSEAETHGVINSGDSSVKAQVIEYQEQ